MPRNTRGTAHAIRQTLYDRAGGPVDHGKNVSTQASRRPYGLHDMGCTTRVVPTVPR
ncbi:MAG: hypothetical protein MZV70_40655 [Desulfobacterales bacterium]|nr:hypothetical protein [Desulfobacterales bacterium]